MSLLTLTPPYVPIAVTQSSLISLFRGLHPPKSIMNIEYPPYFHKIYKFTPYFCKVFNFSSFSFNLRFFA